MMFLFGGLTCSPILCVNIIHKNPELFVWHTSVDRQLNMDSLECILKNGPAEGIHMDRQACRSSFYMSGVVDSTARVVEKESCCIISTIGGFSIEACPPSLNSNRI
jgi:hypothetical protein